MDFTWHYLVVADNNYRAGLLIPELTVTLFTQ